MPERPSHPTSDRSPSAIPLPNHRDEILIAGLLIAALAVLGFWMWRTDQNRLLPLDAHPRPEYRYEIDLCQASWQDLAQIPGIGETLAKRIVVWRDEMDRQDLLQRTSVDDLVQVHGIGPRKLAEIRQYLSLNATQRHTSTGEAKLKYPATIEEFAP